MDSIFEQASSDEWKHNAVADQYHEDDGTLSAGYQRAADLVVAAWPGERFDPLLPPVILLYRHAMELQLKAAISTAEQAKNLTGQPFRAPDELARWFKITAKHHLGTLRDDLIQSLATLNISAMRISVVDLIDELVQVDSNGETFRYSWTRRKDPSGAWQKAQMPRPGATSDGRVNIVTMAKALSEAIEHISAIRSTIDYQMVAPFKRRSTLPPPAP